ncbi:MAG: 3'-5' exonuclease [Moraxella sp.]|nr:3'-5' exonuclease [Moraxella sp.]
MLSFLKTWLGSAQREKHALKRPEFAHLYDPPPKGEWVSLDLEMTGLNPKSDHILSVGAVRIMQVGGVFEIDTKNSLSLVCRPPVMPSYESITVHGLRPVDVENGVDYETMLGTLLAFIGSRPIVGFCTKLDVAFLNEQVRPFLGVPLKNPCLDVSLMEQKIAQKAYGGLDAPVERKHLNELLAAFSIPRLPAHDALNDAIMTAMVFCHLQSKSV